MEIDQQMANNKESKQVDSINRKMLILAKINLIITVLIFIAVSYSCFIKDSVLGYIIVFQGVVLSFLQAIQLLNKRDNKQSLSNECIDAHQEQGSRPCYIIIFYNKYIIGSQYFDFFLETLIGTVYFTFFEVLLIYLDRIQYAIIVSLFLSLYQHAHQKSTEKLFIYMAYTLIQQVYTLIRLQYTIQYNTYEILFNILFIAYSLSYNNAFITRTQKHKINYENQKILTQQVTRLYQNILSIIPEGLAVINSEKKLLYANPTLKKILQSNKRNEIQQILMNLGKNNSNPKEKESEPQEVKVKQHEQSNHKTSISNDAFKMPTKQNQSDAKISLQKVQSKSQEKRFSSTSKYQDPSSSTFAILDCVNQPFYSKSARDIIKDNNTINKDFIQQYKLNSRMPFSNLKRKSNISIQNCLQPEKQKSDPDFSRGIQSSFREILEENTKNQNESMISNFNSKFASNRVINAPPPRTSLKIPTNIPKNNSFFENNQKIQQVTNKNLPKDQSIPSQSNFHQLGSEQSEILSFQGFGFNIGDEDAVSIVPQYAGTGSGSPQKHRKRTSDCYSIKANIDQNSIMTDSLNSQNKQKNNIQGQTNLYNNIAIRLAQMKQQDYPLTLEELKELKCQSYEECDIKNYFNAFQNNVNQSQDNKVKEQSIINSPHLQDQSYSDIQLLNQKKLSTTQKSFFYERNRQNSLSKSQNPSQNQTMKELNQSQLPSNLNQLNLNKQNQKSKDLSNSNNLSGFTLKVKTRGNIQFKMFILIQYQSQYFKEYSYNEIKIRKLYKEIKNLLQILQFLIFQFLFIIPILRTKQIINPLKKLSFLIQQFLLWFIDHTIFLGWQSINPNYLSHFNFYQKFIN